LKCVDCYYLRSAKAVQKSNDDSLRDGIVVNGYGYVQTVAIFLPDVAKMSHL